MPTRPTAQAIRDILSRQGHPLHARCEPDVASRLGPGATDADVLAAATAVLNIRRFTSEGSPVRQAFPNLRSRRVDGRVEWSLRGSHPLAGPGIPLTGALTIDMPCLKRSRDLLDAMAEANDVAVGFAETSASLKAETEHLSQRLQDHVAKLHALVGEDLAHGTGDVGAYLASLETQFADRIVYLYPDRTGGAEGYKPGRHVRELLKSIRHEARRASRIARPGPRTAPRMSLGHSR